LACTPSFRRNGRYPTGVLGQRRCIIAGGLGQQPHFDDFAGDTDEEFLENAQIQGRGRLALRMKLGAEGKSIVRAFDGRDHALGTAGRNRKARRDVVDRHVLHADVELGQFVVWKFQENA
jgi:hypothetical protein